MTTTVLRLKKSHIKFEKLLKKTQKSTPQKNQKDFQIVRHEYRQLYRKISKNLEKENLIERAIDADAPKENIYSIFKQINELQVPEEQKRNYYNEFELSFLEGKITFINEDINKYINLLKNESTISDKSKYAEIEKQWNELRKDTEKMERRVKFFNSNITQSTFEATLMWMVEQGEQEELNLIQKVRLNPPYNSNDIQNLFDLAEREIPERIKQNQKAKLDIIRIGLYPLFPDISPIKEIFSNLIKILLDIWELYIVEKLLEHQPMLTKKEDINLLSRIDKKEISVKINKVPIEQKKLFLGESYNVNFQVFEPEELASQKDFSQEVLEKLCAIFNHKKGLDTEWVISSSTVKLEAAINTELSLTTTKISQGTVWAAKFPLYIPIYGDSIVFPLKIIPKVAQDASLSVLIYACGDIYCQLEIPLNVVSPTSELLSEVVC